MTHPTQEIRKSVADAKTALFDMTPEEEAGMRAEMAAMRAQLAVLHAQLAQQAPAAPQTPAQSCSPETARDLKREANSLLSKIRSSDGMTKLLEALAGNIPSRRLSRVPLKKFMTHAFRHATQLIREASRLSPSITTTEVYKGLETMRDRLMSLETELELQKKAYVSRKEFQPIEELLKSKPLECELPVLPQQAVTDTSDSAPAAVTTEEEGSDAMPEPGEHVVSDEEDDEDESESSRLTIDVERQQTDVPADAPDKVKEAHRLIMGCDSLRKMLRFDLAPFLLRVYENVQHGLDEAEALGPPYKLELSQTAKMFGGGKTQARKTPLKLCAFILCRMMGVATILLTTNVSGRKDLFGKFIQLLGDIVVPTPIDAIPADADDPQYCYYRFKEHANGRETTKVKLIETRKAPAGAVALAAGVISINDIGRNEGPSPLSSRT